MENIEPWQTVVICIGAVLALATVINTIGSAVEKLAKAWRVAQAPNEEQDARLAALEAVTAELQREADRIKTRLDKRDDGMTVVYEAMLALLGHGIDGNNVSEMKEVKRKIENYLINK